MWKKLHLTLFISILIYNFGNVHSVWNKDNAGHAPPVPGMSETSEDLSKPHKEKEEDNGSKLSGSYLPPVMQALHYLVEILPYKLIDMTTIEPPFSIPDYDATSPGQVMDELVTKPTPTTTTTTRRTTTRIPVQWTRPTTTPRTTTTGAPNDQTTPIHKPGLFSPNKPPVSIAMENVYVIHIPIQQADSGQRPTTTKRPPIATKPTQSWQKPTQSWQKPTQSWQKPTQSWQQTTTTTTTSKKPSTSYNGATINSQFFEWFFQPKPKQLRPDFEYNVDLLDQFPKGVLQDINYEGYDVPTLLDEDNVNEFLRVYDDSFSVKQHRFTGDKQKPPTKPFLDMIMLYDLLKREAKKLQLNKFEGYTDELLHELHAISKRSSERQLHTLLSRMIANKDTERTDIIARSNSMIKDLENPYSPMSMAVRYIPTLVFLP